MSRNGGIDWGFGELLALGSLLLEGTPVRMAGQDARRGTFVQRHAVLHDRDERPGVAAAREPRREPGPVLDLRLAAERVRGAWASSTATRSSAPTPSCSGRPSSATSPTAPRPSSTSSSRAPSRSGASAPSVVLLLPHGYEGQGPDHSSARIERYLQLARREQHDVARPSTPASYFHLLRRQAYARPRRPLIVFTPKSMLRLRGATSEVADFTNGQVRAGDRRRPHARITAAVQARPAARRARSTTTCWPSSRSATTQRHRARAAGAVLPAAGRRAQRGARAATRTPSSCGCRTSRRTRAPGRSSASSSRAPRGPHDQGRRRGRHRRHRRPARRSAARRSRPT